MNKISQLTEKLTATHALITIVLVLATLVITTGKEIGQWIASMTADSASEKIRENIDEMGILTFDKYQEFALEQQAHSDSIFEKALSAAYFGFQVQDSIRLELKKLGAKFEDLEKITRDTQTRVKVIEEQNGLIEVSTKESAILDSLRYSLTQIKMETESDRMMRQYRDQSNSIINQLRSMHRQQMNSRIKKGGGSDLFKGKYNPAK